VAEQHQSSDDGKQRQGCDPHRMTNGSTSTEQLDHSHHQRQDRITLMLKNLRVTAEERFHETERADRPSFTVTPDEEVQAYGEQSSRQKKPSPSPERRCQRLAQLAQADDQNQYSNEMMVKLRIGHALD